MWCDSFIVVYKCCRPNTIQPVKSQRAWSVDAKSTLYQLDKSGGGDAGGIDKGGGDVGGGDKGDKGGGDVGGDKGDVGGGDVGGVDKGGGDKMHKDNGMNPVDLKDIILSDELDDEVGVPQHGDEVGVPQRGDEVGVSQRGDEVGMAEAPWNVEMQFDSKKVRIYMHRPNEGTMH